MLKQFIYSTAFFWIILIFIIPSNRFALENSNWLFIIGQAIGNLLVSMMLSLFVVGFSLLVKKFQKIDTNNTQAIPHSTRYESESQSPSVFTDPKEWRENTSNIYYKRNLWVLLDFALYFFAALFLSPILSIPTMLIFGLTPAKEWALDIGIETFGFIYTILIFIILDVRGHMVRGGTLLFNKMGKLKIVDLSGKQPKFIFLVLRAVLKLFIIPAIIAIIPFVFWAFTYIIAVADKTNVSPIDMLTKTKAVNL